MPYPWISPDQVSRRIGRLKVHRTFDDDRDGVADADELDELVLDSCARVAAAIRASRIYRLADIIAMPQPPREVVRLSLDVAQMYAAKRHPEVIRADWKEMEDAVKAELAALADGAQMLDADTIPDPEPEPGEEVATEIVGGIEMDSDMLRGW